MYNLTRKLHLILSLGILPFVLVYAVSSFVIAHHLGQSFGPQKSTIGFDLAVAPEDLDAFAEWLATEQGIRGKITQSKRSPNGNLSLSIRRLGARHEVTFIRAKGRVRNTVESQSAVAFTTSLHLAAGWRDKPPAEQAWGVAAFGVACALVVIVVTGFILWLWRRQERRTGVIFLAVSSIYCVVVLAVIRLG